MWGCECVYYDVFIHSHTYEEKETKKEPHGLTDINS